MQLRKRNIFTTIRAEGSILPADLLQRINDRDAHLKGLTPDDYHLAGGLKLNEAINRGTGCRAHGLSSRVRSKSCPQATPARP
jgi:hypothetical protein